jgi:hypothetical protein
MQQPHSEIMDRLNDAELIRALEAPYEYPREAAAAWKLAERHRQVGPQTRDNNRATGRPDRWTA